MTDTYDHDATLASRLALLDRCRRAEIRATTAQVAAVIAHMIGTPLNVIVGRAALLKANQDPESVQDNVRRIEEQTQRLTERIQRLIDYLDAPDPTPDARPAREIVSDALALYGPVARFYGRTLRLKRDDLPETPVEDTRTLGILTALLSLAIRCSGEAATVELDARAATGAAGVLFELWVPGMEPVEGRIDRLDPPDNLELRHLGRTKMLAVCAASAQKSGGKLDVKADEAGRGVTMCLQCEASG
jgi:signal transduction histidine kinase